MTVVPRDTPPPSRDKLAGVEAGRGIAATLVVLYHASNHIGHNVGYKPLGGAFQFGHAGVDFFFVLSGFIIWFVHAGDLGKPPRLAHYLQRRFTRIYPIYWFVTLLSLALGALLSSRPQPVAEALYDALLLPGRDEPYIGVAWTLQYEVLFYVIFAIGIVSRRAGVAAVLGWLALIAAPWTFGRFIGDSPLSNRLSSTFNLEFFFGMLAASLIRSGRVRPGRGVLATGLLLFGLAAIAEDLGVLDGFAPVARFAYGLPSILLVMGATAIRRTEGVASRCAMALGAASYSIYLSHLLFIGIVYKAAEMSGLFDRLPPTLVWAAMSAAGVLGGIAVSRWVEHPLMRWVRGQFVRRHAIAAG